MRIGSIRFRIIIMNLLNKICIYLDCVFTFVPLDGVKGVSFHFKTASQHG